MSLPSFVKDVKANKKYIFVEEWGRGAYGKCFLVREDNNFYVCKVCEDASFQLEVEVHRKLKDEHIVQFISAFSKLNAHYMLLEPCENGTVDLLLKCRKNLTNPEVRCIATQVARGLDYLHGQLIIHRDIKPSNLLLSGTMMVKIADFGLSLVLSDSREKLTTICGTEYYIAPEVKKEIGYSFEVDIWALGCVVYTLLDGKAPFSKDTTTAEIENFARKKTASSSKIGLLAWQFLKTIFTINPSARPTAKTVTMHSYFQTAFTPERLPPSVFFKKCKKPSDTNMIRKPLADRTNELQAKPAPSFTNPKTGKENIATNAKKPKEKLPSEFTMSLRGQKARQALPFVESVWIDGGAKLAKRMLDELRDIRELRSDWELDGKVSSFTCVDCWVAGIGAFAYKINNGALGVDFAGGDFFHRSSEGREHFYGPSCYIDGFEKKTFTKTLRYIDAFMKCLNSSGPKTDNKEEAIVVVKKCYLPKEETSEVLAPAIGFLLSNGSCQMNYSNHDKLIVNLHEDLIVSWNAEKVKMCTFQDLRRRGIPTSLGKKVEQMCIFLTVSQNLSK